MPSASYLGILADAAEAADAPVDYVARCAAAPAAPAASDPPAWFLVTPCTPARLWSAAAGIRVPGRAGGDQLPAAGPAPPTTYGGRGLD